MNCRLALLLSAFAMTSSAAIAQAPTVALTGPLASAVEQANTTPGIDADEAAVILSVILEGSSADPATAISPQEGALLQTLVEARAPFAVAVDGRSLTVWPLQPDGARFLVAAFRGDPGLPAALEVGNTEALLHVARLFGQPHQDLVFQSRALMADDLMKAWRNSSIGNSYEPLREKLRIAAQLYEAAPPATANAGRRLLYSAMEMVDRNANGSVPDFLYERFKN